MNELRSLEGLLTVLSLLRTGSPVKAARGLGCAPSTVYRTLDRLERGLGTGLFVRSASGWTATDAGKQVADLAERLEAEIASTQLALLRRSELQPAAVKVSVSDSFATYLSPILAELAADSDGTAIEISIDNEFADLGRRESDIALRPDMRPGNALVGLRAGRLAHALYGSRRLLRRGGVPRTLEELAKYDLCLLAPSLSHFSSSSWWEAQNWPNQPRVSLISNTETTLAAGIAAGAGIGLLPRFLGDAMPELERLTDMKLTAPVDIWIVTHRALRRNTVVSSVIRKLSRAIRRDAQLFLGTR